MTDEPISPVLGENVDHYGWLKSSDAKNELHQTLYSWHDAVPETVAVVNVINTIPNEFVNWYNQGNHNSCVAASSAQAMAWMNWKQIGLKQYDIWQMYCKICDLDQDPVTSCANDVGAFTFASGDCLKKFGPYEVGKGWKEDQGIDRYLWARKGQNGVDDIRSAISFSTQVSNSQICCIGMPWFDKMGASSLKKDENGNWWFPRHARWGNHVGGHQIGIYDAVDTAQAFGFVNSWGNNWPRKVYMHYDDMIYLLNQGGECAIFVDKSFDDPNPPPPPPPPPTVESITLTSIVVTDASGSYKGENIKLPKVA